MRPLDDELIRLLEDERPEADPEFSRRLDEWAAAGFPRAERPSRAGEKRTGFAALRDRLQATPPRRLIAPIGALATLGVVVGVAVTQLPGSSEPSPTVQTDIGALETSGGGDISSESLPAKGGPAATAPAAPGAASVPSEAAPVPDVAKAPGPVSGAGSGGSAIAPSTNPKIAQDVNLSLSTQPDELRNVADSVLQVTDAHHGLVVSSNVSTSDPTSGQAGGRADFELRIPASELPATLDDLSGLAHVSSRTDGSVDITKRFKTTQQRIQTLREERRATLEKLANAQTQDRTQYLHSYLHSLRAQLDRARAQLSHEQQRVHLVPVSVTITGDEPPDSGGWSFSDALHDAGHVLTVAAGVALISVAVLVPIALVAALIAIAWKLALRRSRERALDQA